MMLPGNWSLGAEQRVGAQRKKIGLTSEKRKDDVSVARNRAAGCHYRFRLHIYSK